MLQANWAGKVRLKLIVRIGDSSNLESHERLSRFLISYLEDHIRICRKKSRTYSKLEPKRSVQNSTSKRGISRLRHILEDTPGDTEIHVFVFDHSRHRQISKRRTFGNFKVI